MSEKPLSVNTRMSIGTSADKIFEAIVDPEKMSEYFISSGSDRLDSGYEIIWKWVDVGTELKITPNEVVKDKLISFSWLASGTETLVTITLSPYGTSTSVGISEAGWPSDKQGIQRCMQQTEGWVHMLCCMKAAIEYGINLRAGRIAD